MRKTFKYKIYPSKKVRKELNKTLRSCQYLYNKILETRIKSWEEEKKTLSGFDCNYLITEWKKDDDRLEGVHSQVFQNVSNRVDLAFKGFFRRVKKGETPGFPRFKSWKRYDSFTFSQVGYKFNDDRSRLRLSKTGSVKINLHRPIRGEIKTLTIRKDACGDWWACFSVELGDPKLPKPKKIMKAVGIDMGSKTWATFSDGGTVEKPYHLKPELKDLARAQRGKKAYTPKVYRRVNNKRSDFLHKAANKIVREHDIICVENLDIRSILKKNYSSANRKFMDCSWATFVGLLSYKAEEAGKIVVKVNPKNTSKTCSKCGEIHEMDVSVRRMVCSCGNDEDRDVNAAKNILALGLQSIKDSNPYRSPRIYSGE